MQIRRRNEPILEVINKKKYDVLTKSSKTKELLDILINLGILKLNDKKEYYVDNPYNEGAKYPNIEKNIDWFAKIYSEGEINQENPFEDLDTVESELKEFESLKSRNILPNEIKIKHINKFTYSDIKDITTEYGEKITITQALKVDKSIKQEELPNVKSPFKVIKVTDPYTATQLANKPHLKWCVKHISHAKDYLIESKGPLFFVYKNEEEFALLSFGGGAKNHGELMNPKDVRLTKMEMQEIKDHWSQVKEYLRVFNIHDYDADYNFITKGINKEIEKNKDKVYPDDISYKFSEIIRYADSNIVDYIKSKGQDISSIEDEISYSSETRLSEIKEEEFKRLFLAFIKSKIIRILERVEGNHKYKQIVSIQNGQVKISFLYNDLFSYSSKLTSTYSSKEINSSVDNILDSGGNNPTDIYNRRVQYTFQQLVEKIDRALLLHISYNTLEEFANAI